MGNSCDLEGDYGGREAETNEYESEEGERGVRIHGKKGKVKAMEKEKWKEEKRKTQAKEMGQGRET